MAKKKRGAVKGGKQNDRLHILFVGARFYDNISDELLRGASKVVPIGVDRARRAALTVVALKNTLAWR